MKKVLFASALLFLSTVSFADTQPAPLRMATVHGTLSKMTASYSPINVRQEKVCDVQADIPVYLSAAGDVLKNLPVCTSTINGEAVKIYLSTSIEIHPQDGTNGPSKIAEAIMNIQTPTNDNIFQQASAGSTDLSLKSILLSVSSQGFSSGQPVTEETFTFTLSYEDLNQ